MNGVTGTGLGTVLSPRVVGRDVELAHLRSALDAAAEGRGSVLFLVGEAGIGKSRLAQAVASDAADGGWPVLRGRAVQAATPVAYRPLAEALCSAVRTASTPSGAELGPYRPTLGRLIPEWRADDQSFPDESVVALAEAVLRFLRITAGDRGCLLVLEDLHWSDPVTLQISEYLADNLTSERVLCVATLRRRGPFGRARPGAGPARQARFDPPATIPSRPAGSGRDGEFVSQRGNGSPRRSRLAARADGIPFLVEELLADFTEGDALEVGCWSEPMTEGLKS